MSKNIKIRLAKRGEGAEMFKVTTNGWLSTYPNEALGITVEAIQERLKSKNKGRPILQTKKSHTWVAVDGEKIVGFTQAQLLSGKNYLGATYVLDEYRGQGIGTRLLGKAEKWFGEGAEIIADVASYNHRAINFYKKHGFVKSGRVRRPLGTRLPNGACIPIFEITKKP